MMQFLICFVGIGLVAVPAIVMFAYGFGDKRDKIVGALAVLFFWILISGAMTYEAKYDFDVYNNGVCVVCDGEYKFSGATKYRTSHHYYYTCENCDHTIELNSLMK